MPRPFIARFIATTGIALWLLAGCASAPSVRHAEVNGTRLTYVEEGRGEPVVFVHGSMADHRQWDRQRAALAASGYRAIAYTQRYFGTDPWSESWPKFGVPLHSEDLAAFIRSLGAGPVHLVAWSYGGHTALNVALKHPELVKSAFIYEPAVPSYVSDAADLKALADDRAPLAGPAVAAVKTGDHATGARLLLDGADNRKGVLDGWSAQDQAMVRDNARTLQLLFSSEPPPAISCTQLAQIKAPLVIARGELTRPFYRIIADTAARCATGSKHVVAPGGRHLWPGEDVSAFNESLLAFLRR